MFPFIVSIISPNMPYIEWSTRRDNIILLHFCRAWARKFNLIRYHHHRPVIVTDRANYLSTVKVWKKRDVHNYLGMRYSMTMQQPWWNAYFVASRVLIILFCSNSKTNILTYWCIVQIRAQNNITLKRNNETFFLQILL